MRKTHALTTCPCSFVTVAAVRKSGRKVNFNFIDKNAITKFLKRGLAEKVRRSKGWDILSLMPLYSYSC